MTKDQAIKMSESNWWEDKSDEEIVRFQLYEEKLCMPFSKFHESVEKVLGRPVFTHEFVYSDHLEKEFEGLYPMMKLNH